MDVAFISDFNSNSRHYDIAIDFKAPEISTTDFDLNFYAIQNEGYNIRLDDFLAISSVNFHGKLRKL